MSPSSQTPPEPSHAWDLLSGHGLVLLALVRDAEVTARRLSKQLGYSERRLFDMLRDLEDAGFIQRERRGRNNHFFVNPDAAVRIPGLSDVPVCVLLHSLRRES